MAKSNAQRQRDWYARHRDPKAAGKRVVKHTLAYYGRRADLVTPDELSGVMRAFFKEYNQQETRDAKDMIALAEWVRADNERRHPTGVTAKSARDKFMPATIADDDRDG